MSIDMYVVSLISCVNGTGTKREHHDCQQKCMSRIGGHGMNINMLTTHIIHDIRTHTHTRNACRVSHIMYYMSHGP